MYGQNKLWLNVDTHPIHSDLYNHSVLLTSLYAYLLIVLNNQFETNKSIIGREIKKY